MKELFRDVSSFSNLSHYKTNHINWYLDVDFALKVLRCKAVLKLECILTNESSDLILDTRLMNFIFNALTLSVPPINKVVSMKALRDHCQSPAVKVDETQQLNCFFFLTKKQPFPV